MGVWFQTTSGFPETSSCSWTGHMWNGGSVSLGNTGEHKKRWEISKGLIKGLSAFMNLDFILKTVGETLQDILFLG